MNNLSQQDCCDEIELKELFFCLWRNKVMIIILTLLFAIVTFLFSKFVIKPVFKANVDIIIDMPESINTNYGGYSLVMSSNDQYINLIKSNTVLTNTIKDINIDDINLDSLRKNISISKDDKKPNLFSIEVKANSPKNSYIIANSLYKNYMEFVTSMINNVCIDNFYNHFNTIINQKNISLEKAKETLENNIKLLNTIDKTYSIDEILDLDNLKLKSIILASPINTNYTKVELDILNNKQSINSISNDIALYETYLKELKVFKQNFKNKDDNASWLIQLEGIHIVKPCDIIVPTKKISPRNALNTAIGGILGLMLSIFIALIKTYWFSENKKAV